MRRSPRIATLALAAFLAAALMGLGCASRKQVSTTTPEAPPPATTETETAPPPPPPSSESTQQGDPQMSLEDAYFEYDDAGLRPDAKAALESNARFMERNPGVAVVVEGHCDERGSVEYNLALGERRAKAAKEFLVAYGIAASRLTTISYGKERPFDPGHHEAAWAKNRRAHFVSR